MSTIELLARIIAQRAKVSIASVRLQSGFGQLLEHGYLCHAGVVASLACVDCDQTHDAEVVFDHGTYGYFCPDLGFVPVDGDDVRAVIPDIPKLIENLANAFECRRRKTPPLHGDIWRIGAVGLDQGPATLFFQPFLRDAEDARAFDAAQILEPRSTWRLIVTAKGTLTIQGATTIRLSELVDLDASRGRLVAMSDLSTLLGIRALETLVFLDDFRHDLPP